MKINEIIVESSLRKGSEVSTPGMETWPALNNNNSPYAAYRFGLALATSPERTVDKSGPIGGDFTTIAYSEADEAILKNAAKNMGIESTTKSTRGSKELDSTLKTSPVRQVGAIQLKKKK